MGSATLATSGIYGSTWNVVLDREGRTSGLQGISAQWPQTLLLFEPRQFTSLMLKGVCVHRPGIIWR